MVAPLCIVYDVFLFSTTYTRIAGCNAYSPFAAALVALVLGLLLGYTIEWLHHIHSYTRQA